MNVYVRAYCSLTRLDEDPDFRQILSPLEARRMNLFMKRALYVSLETLGKAGPESPGGIVTGTALGSADSTMNFLEALSEGSPRPTDFMQSTHNTVGSMIAIKTRCRGYNATYAHLYHSFESALLDGFMQVGSGESDNILVGAFDEVTPAMAGLLQRSGYGFDAPCHVSAAFLLTSREEGSLARISDVRLSLTPLDVQADITRKDYVSLYGDNPSSSAPALCDAISKGGKHVISNDIEGLEYSAICIN